MLHVVSVHMTPCMEDEGDRMRRTEDATKVHMRSGNRTIKSTQSFDTTINSEC